MPVARYQLPDGRIARFDVPDGTTPDQAQQIGVDFFSQQQAPAAPAPTQADQPIDFLAKQAEFEKTRGPFQLGKALKGAGRQILTGQTPSDIKRGEIALQKLRDTAPVGQEFARDLEEFGAAPELNQFNLESVKSSLAANLIMNPAELATSLKENIPGSEISQDPEGNPLIKMPSGETFAINKPGLSGQDFVQFATRLLAFIPSSRVAGAGAQQLAKGAGAAVATEAGLQTAEASLGGEFDKLPVALSGAIQPAAQVITPLVAGAAKRFAAARAGQAQKELLDESAKTGVKVLTTDLFPPESFFGRALRNIGEKLGPLGTGLKRSAQQKARIEVVEEFSKKLGLGVDPTPQTAEMVRSLNRGVAKELEKAGQMRGEAIFRLSPLGNVPVEKVQEEITKQIAKQTRLKADANPQIIERLTNLSDSIGDANFGLLTALRSNLGDDIAAAAKGDALPTKAQAPLAAVMSKLTDSMTEFGRGVDRGATAQWLQANKRFTEVFGKARNSILKNVIKKGDATPETIATVIKAGKISDLRKLNSLLDAQGRSNARTSIIRDAMEESGGFALAGANPDRFVRALQTPARQRAINTFFGGADKKQLDGMIRLLEATKRAQQTAEGTKTGLGELIPGAAVVGIPIAAFMDAFSTFLVGGTIIGAAKGYESKAVRNLLIKLSNTKAASQAEQDIVKGLIPLLAAPAQATQTTGQ